MALRIISTPPNRPPFWLEHALRGGRLTRRYQARTPNTRREKFSRRVLVLTLRAIFFQDCPFGEAKYLQGACLGTALPAT
jgi:hypothetical protein